MIPTAHAEAKLKIFTFSLLFLLFGCATTGQRDLIDFNSRFKQSISTNPQYKVEQVASNRYQVVVYQGQPLLSERTTRVAFLTQAAYFVMEHHCTENLAVLGDHSLRDDVDGWGYINVLGFFSCKPDPAQTK
jgi:hypothetical protein